MPLHDMRISRVDFVLFKQVVPHVILARPAMDEAHFYHFGTFNKASKLIKTSGQSFASVTNDINLQSDVL